MLLQRGTQCRQIRSVSLLRNGQTLCTEQLERLQRGEIGRRLDQHLGARVDEQLRGEIQRLLRPTDNQHLAGLAGHAERPGLSRDGFAKGGFAFAHAVLPHARRQLGPIHRG